MSKAGLDFFEAYNFIWLDENGQQIFVSDGISKGRQWGTFRRNKNGALQRIKSTALPMVGTKSEAQRMLNSWAEAKGYKLLCVFGKKASLFSGYRAMLQIL
jgi:hypothetical protein